MQLIWVILLVLSLLNQRRACRFLTNMLEIESKTLISKQSLRIEMNQVPFCYRMGPPKTVRYGRRKIYVGLQADWKAEHIHWWMSDWVYLYVDMGARFPISTRGIFILLQFTKQTKCILKSTLWTFGLCCWNTFGDIHWGRSYIAQYS